MSKHQTSDFKFIKSRILNHKNKIRNLLAFSWKVHSMCKRYLPKRPCMSPTVQLYMFPKDSCLSLDVILYCVYHSGKRWPCKSNKTIPVDLSIILFEDCRHLIYNFTCQIFNEFKNQLAYSQLAVQREGENPSQY